MALFATVFFPAARGWRDADVEEAVAAAADPDEPGGIDEVADALRDAAGAVDPTAPEGTMLLFLEADDEWFGVVRLDDREDPRVFLSDARAVHEHPAAALLLDSGAIDAPEQTEGTGQKPQPVPGGDSAVLDGFGTSARELVDMTTAEGALPAEVLGDLAERAGFADLYDAARL
ncbi:tRNA adenosine deaminase-associated protein [Nocardiopsis coralliicola]